MQVTGLRPKIVAAADGRGVVGHAGARLLADLADATGLTGAFSDALAPLRVRQSGHDPGRIAVDLAVMLADGGEAIADLAVLRNRADLFGLVACDPTAWRLLSDVDGAALARLREARAHARELAWTQAWNGVPAGNLIRAGQAACSYTRRMPPRRSRRRMSRRASWSGSVIGSGSG
jgi:hypothetical protein